MKISVITICYNEEKNIATTIESVLSQTVCDFEYLICDGKSSDATVEIAESYIEKFKQKNVDFKIFSEKDGGIYFGMNNGIDRAQGDYVLFLNAGDKFYSSDVLAEIIAKVNGRLPDVIYGDCMLIDRCVASICKTDHTQLKEHMSIGHPSTLVRADVIKANKFDTTYRIAADYNMMLGLYMKNMEFLHLDLIISKFYLGGISSVQVVKTKKEVCSIQESHGIQVDVEAVLAKAKKTEFKNKLRSKAPKVIWKIWNKNIKKRMWIEE